MSAAMTPPSVGIREANEPLIQPSPNHEELVKRLEGVRSTGIRQGKLWNPDGPEAASAIRSLVTVCDLFANANAEQRAALARKDAALLTIADTELGLNARAIAHQALETKDDGAAS